MVLVWCKLKTGKRGIEKVDNEKTKEEAKANSKPSIYTIGMIADHDLSLCILARGGLVQLANWLVWSIQKTSRARIDKPLFMLFVLLHMYAKKYDLCAKYHAPEYYSRIKDSNVRPCPLLSSVFPCISSW